jgi:hypothetical protein
MSATPATLQPHDNAELLRASARLLASGGGRSARASGKRDLLLSMQEAQLLLASAAGVSLRRVGPKGALMVAFTDQEAADAWVADQHPAAHDHDGFVLSSPEPPSSEREGRRLWLALLEEHDAVAVIVNPSGPLGFAAYHDELEGVRPRLLRRSRPGDEHAWLEPSARASARTHAAELLRSLSEVIAAADEPGFERLRPELGQLNALGSPAVAASNQVLSGRWRLGHGDTEDGIYQLLWGGYAWGRYVADPYRCIDTLLEGGELLDRLRGAGEPAWVDTYRGELTAALRRMPLGYREDEIDRLLAT